MLKTLVRGLQRLSPAGRRADPSQFDDPVAQRTSWSPLKRGGANFCTRRLVETDPYRLEFRATLGAKVFYVFFLLVGLGALIFVPITMASQSEPVGTLAVLLPVVIGLIFAIVGGCLYYFGTTPIVFDRSSDYYWKGRYSPNAMPDRDIQSNCTRLNRIHALQLISEWCRGDKSSYYSYELNLVLENGDRLNVVDHGNARRLREDAARLASFLDVPVWDAA